MRTHPLGEKQGWTIIFKIILLTFLPF